MPTPPQSADSLDRALRLGALLGAVLWPLWWVLGGAAMGMQGEIGLALVGGVAVVLPLALLLARQQERGGRDPLPFRVAALTWPLSAPLAVLSLLGSPGPLSAALALPWLVTTGAVGCFGLRRLARRPHHHLPSLCVDAGLIYLPVGAVWLLASRAGVSLLGFSEPWTSLTAAHFHFAGLGVPLLLGLAGHGLARLADADGLLPTGLRGAWTVPAWAAILGPPMTAVGIASSRWVELLGATVMVVGAVGGGAVLVTLAAAGPFSRSARAVLGVAGLVPVLTGALAFIYAASNFLGSPFPSMPAMVRYHGLVNAVLLVAGGLVGLALAGVRDEQPAPGVPFSRLRAGTSVGRWFFRSVGAVAEGPAPRGLVDSMEVARRSGIPGLHDLDPEQLAPAVRRFYEDTSAFQLQVTPRWRAPAAWVSPLVRALGRAVGQLELPGGEVAERAMDGELVPLRDAVDGRDSVRGWIRTHGGTDRPVFVAAYAWHQFGGVPYMNIAMPLPGANLSSILRVDPGSHGGLVLTTRRLRGFAGDEGLYLVTRFGELRLPMHETLILGLAGGRGPDNLAARHVIHVLGLPVLELTYLIEPVEA